MKELNIFNVYASKDFDVFFQGEAALDTEVEVCYLAYGKDEIQNYVNDVVKPDIDEYIEQAEEALVSYHIDLGGNILSLEGTGVQTSSVDLSNLSFDNRYVTLNTIQNIDEVKTFTKNPIVSKNAAPAVNVQNTSTLFGSSPQEDQMSAINFCDASETVMGCLKNEIFSDGSLKTSLGCSNLEADACSEIGIGYDVNGDVYTKAPTPDVSDDSTQIATTEWVNDQGYITSISSTDVTTALGYTPAENDLSNVLISASAVFDGQWVASTSAIASSVSVSSSDATYSLSTYLQNDGYKYAVLFNAKVTTTASTGKEASVILTSSEVGGVYVVRAQTSASVAIIGIASAVVPVGTDRNITVDGETSSLAAGTYDLTAIAYRRIGTNS